MGLQVQVRRPRILPQVSCSTLCLWRSTIHRNGYVCSYISFLYLQNFRSYHCCIRLKDMLIRCHQCIRKQSDWRANLLLSIWRLLMLSEDFVAFELSALWFQTVTSIMVQAILHNAHQTRTRSCTRGKMPLHQPTPHGILLRWRHRHYLRPPLQA